MHDLSSLDLPSIRFRLTRWVMAVSMAAGVVLATTVGVLLHHALDDLMDDGLQESAEVLYGILGQEQARALLRSGLLPVPSHDEGLIWQWMGDDGQVWLRSHRAPATPLTNRSVLGFSHAPHWRHAQRGVWRLQRQGCA